MEKTLHEKLVAIQSELKAPKGQTNLFGKYKYRSCEDILEALKPLLKEHGVTLSLSDEVVNIGTRFYVKSTASIADGASFHAVHALAREEEAKKGMDGAQITGAASSYARKYALNGLFCIDDTKDADSMDNTQKAVVPQKEAPKVDHADTKQLAEVSRLCKECGGTIDKLYETFKVVNGMPTKEQAQKMIEVLTAKLSKHIDEAESAAKAA